LTNDFELPVTNNAFDLLSVGMVLGSNLENTVLNMSMMFFFLEHNGLGYIGKDRLCGLVVRVSGYRYRGPGFDPRRYQIF